MISVKNQFQDNNLEIEFSGDNIETKNISVSISNDVNFKSVIDYLIEIIPNKVKLEPSFQDFSQEENVEKLGLIKETIEEIYEEFNQSLENMVDQEENEEEDTEINQSDPNDDDLPF
ncbi:MAG: hypothetical protein ACOCUT_01115 [bacterium]